MRRCGTYLTAIIGQASTTGLVSGAQLHIVPGAAHAAIFEMPEDAGGAIAKWSATAMKAG